MSGSENGPSQKPDVTEGGNTANAPQPNKDKGNETLAAVPYILPLAVYLASGWAEGWLTHEYGERLYPIAYAARLVLTLVALAFSWKVLRKHGWKIGWWSAAAGAIGVVLWVALCIAQQRMLQDVTLPDFLAQQLAPGRAAFNPFDKLAGSPLQLVLFLAVRLTGMAVVVPVIEELFLRGFLVPFMEDADWQQWPFGKMTAVGLVSATVYGMATHPGEQLAAAVWFSLISVLAMRTRSLGSCIAAHVVTNLLLAVYILRSGAWELW